MDGIAMQITRQNSPNYSHIDEICALSAAFEEWRNWCVSRGVCPNSFRRNLERMGVNIHRDTAISWWNGETLPSIARVIELTAKGAIDLPDKILGPAKVAASVYILERKLEDAERTADAATKEAAELRAALDRRKAGGHG